MPQPECTDLICPGRANQWGRIVIARSDEAIHTCFAERWIASRSLSSGARSRDPLARNDGENLLVRHSGAREARTSDVQLHIGESRDSGFVRSLSSGRALRGPVGFAPE